MVVVVVDDDVVDVVLLLIDDELVEVVGVTTGGMPQSGGVGSVVPLHTLTAARRVSLHSLRQVRPAFPFGQAARQVVHSAANSFLHDFGQRAASTAGPVSRRIAKATRRTRDPWRMVAFPGRRTELRC